MAKGYNPTEYMYSSARIRALETKIASRERLLHLADADSAETVLAQLSDFGFETVKDGESILREETLESVLKAGYAEVSSMECAEAVQFLKYQYDANNIKAMIKCASRGISPDGMLLDLGSLSLSEAKRAFEDKDYSSYPANMSEAISSAEEAFAATANPQKIDFIIDRACFADILAAAKASGIGLALRLATAKIDLVNIMMTLRIMRMHLGNTAEGVLAEAYIEGGSRSLEFYLAALSGGEESFAEELSRGTYERIAEAISENESLSLLEKRADDLWLEVAKEAKRVTFGAEIAIGYIVALEYEVKNARIILAGKDAGLSPDIIKERLRECYA
jgi:V/A-type H+-transporting ATPase subunit C